MNNFGDFTVTFILFRESNGRDSTKQRAQTVVLATAVALGRYGTPAKNAPKLDRRIVRDVQIESNCGDQIVFDVYNCHTSDNVPTEIGLVVRRGGGHCFRNIYMVIMAELERLNASYNRRMDRFEDIHVFSFNHVLFVHKNE